MGPGRHVPTCSLNPGVMLFARVLQNIVDVLTVVLDEVVRSLHENTNPIRREDGGGGYALSADRLRDREVESISATAGGANIGGDEVGPTPASVGETSGDANQVIEISDTR